ncbi:expressed unknown protein [Seminavis robusta]|uniref:Uncharacterized protein n=1 Tax=Seminavis robusta TaxID=568900 RepID=A0A9N8EWW3_9STRA|nr:expressed unknown protein [Seminavis robusta]|eukprot:Sro2000_g310210.1 n/a (132) ;mRNA; r:7980-8611
MSGQMTMMERLKKAGKTMVDAGAKTMLKTDIVFLDREIKLRKQSFGIEIYDLMEELESNAELNTSQKESKIRNAFDQARKDIAVIQAKKECKIEEMAVLEAEENGQGQDFKIPPSSGTVLTNSHPSGSDDH